MRLINAVQVANLVTTDSAGVFYEGGQSCLSIQATTFGTTVNLQKLASDGTTWLNVVVNNVFTTLSVNGVYPLYAPKGTYRIHATGGTTAALTAWLEPVPS